MPSSRPDLLAAVDHLGTTAWSGIGYRLTSPDRDPRSGHGAYLYGGRWNPREAFPCIYLGEPRDACIAEFYRRAQGQARGAASLLPQTLHTLEVADLDVLDLTTDDARGRVRLSTDDIEADDRIACQEVGAAAHFLGCQGVRAPSATGVGFVVAVFERHLRHGQLTVASSENLELG